MTDTEKQYSIYKIVAKDPTIQECYVGSTIDFVRRKYEHKNACINPNRKEHNRTIYKFIRENGGWKNWDMIELEIIESTQIESLKLERKYMDELEATLNIIRAYITDEEKVEYQIQYYIDNKEKISQLYICDCGSRITQGSRLRHFKTTKHQKYLLSNENQNTPCS